MANEGFGDSDDQPFAGLPFFGDMMKMFANQGPVQWDMARQLALVIATEGKSEPNPDPSARVAFVDLSRIVSAQVQAVTGFDDPSLDVEPSVVTRAVWLQRTLDDYKPLFVDLATALKPPTESPEDAESDPMAAMFANLTSMLAPALMGMTIGSMVGLLAKRSLGQYDLPLPRRTGGSPMFVLSNIDSFASEWSLPVDDVRMWTLITEMSLHTVLGIPHVTAEVEGLVRRHVAAFRPDPSAITDKLAEVETSDPMQAMQSLQKVFNDPEVLLGAVRSAEQDALQPSLDAVVALVIGWADHIADEVGRRVLGNPARLAEASRRRRVEGGDETTFVEKLLGLRLDRRQVERGRAFVAGVVERAGTSGLAPLHRRADSVPTPAELDAPGLWLARLEISDAD